LKLTQREYYSGLQKHFFLTICSKQLQIENKSKSLFSISIRINKEILEILGETHSSLTDNEDQGAKENILSFTPLEIKMVKNKKKNCPIHRTEKELAVFQRYRLIQN